MIALMIALKILANINMCFIFEKRKEYYFYAGLKVTDFRK